MNRPPSSVDAVRLYLQKQIDRRSTRISAPRKPGPAKPRRGVRRRPLATGSALAERRAYRDALRALSAVRSDGNPAPARLAAEELERVKSALARIYEVTQHANHDITEAGDWAIVEGEAQTALNIVHEAERTR
jgi:hypothetical protein